MDYVYWIPSLVGAMLFCISSLLLILETELEWWRIRPFNLDWECRFFNLLGSIGFLLCAIFGFSTAEGY